MATLLQVKLRVTDSSYAMSTYGHLIAVHGAQNVFPSLFPACFRSLTNCFRFIPSTSSSEAFTVGPSYEQMASVSHSTDRFLYQKGSICMGTH